MNIDDALESLSSFLDEGWISGVLFEVKSGKEATVFCCQGGERCPGRLLAAKVYRPMEERRFRNDAIYQEGRMHLARASRVQRAVRNRSRFGMVAHAATWLEQEWVTMNLIHNAGADVPQPIARAPRAILMEFVGDAQGAAPLLHSVRLDPGPAAALLERLLWNVELMLDHDCVHGDLSAFNILYYTGTGVGTGTRTGTGTGTGTDTGRATIIDFPQTVDPRLNHAARTLLTRDVEGLCAWANRMGIGADAGAIAGRLWHRFQEGRIG